MTATCCTIHPTPSKPLPTRSCASSSWTTLGFTPVEASSSSGPGRYVVEDEPVDPLGLLQLGDVLRRRQQHRRD